MKIQIKSILAIILLFSIKCISQETIKTSVQYGVKDIELQQVLLFQNITIETFTFEQEKIKNKSYQVFVKEYIKDSLVSKSLLFDGTETDYFKIKDNTLTFKIFAQVFDEEIKLQLTANGFSSAQKKFDLLQNSHSYAVKDFFGPNQFVENPLNEEFALQAIITPTIRPDGSGSYCNVVQAKIKPEELGKHFNIPHYFLVTIKFI